MPRASNRLRELLLLAAACGFFFFFRLSAIGLIGPDEPRYAQVAREMLARHDWVTPVLYHHTWLEKPILLYWGEMLSYLLFGVCDWAARVPSAVAATLLVFGTYFALRRIRPQASLDAALMLASSVLILGFARAAATDMLLASCWCLSLLAWFCWYESSGVENSEAGPHLPASSKCAGVASLYLFYVLNALGMLAKGPVAPVLAAFVLVAFCVAQRNMRAVLRSLNPIGILLFLAVAAPWYLMVQLRTPEFFHVFFLQHNLARFGSNLYRHRQPFWYYLPVALVATIPWTIWMLHGVGDGFRALREVLYRTQKQLPHFCQTKAEMGHPHRTQNDGGPVRPQVSAAKTAARNPGHHPFTFEIYLLLWALVPIVFFSISRSKLPGYVLPSMPALLILSALAVHRRADCGERPSRAATVAHAALLGAIAAGACLVPRLILKLPLRMPPSTATLMIAAATGSAVFLLVVLGLRFAGWRWLRLVTLLPVILIVGFVLRGVAPILDSTQSARPVAQALRHSEEADTALASLHVATIGLNRNMAFGLAFYLDRRVDPYGGLEISPAVYELPPGVPREAHLLVSRAPSSDLHRLLSGRSVVQIGGYDPLGIEFYQVSATR